MKTFRYFLRLDASLSASEKDASLFFAFNSLKVFMTSRFQLDNLRVPFFPRERRVFAICIFKVKNFCVRTFLIRIRTLETAVQNFARPEKGFPSLLGLLQSEMAQHFQYLYT